MIKKARIRFVAVTMSIILFVLLAIFIGFMIIMNGANDRLATTELDKVLDFYLETDQTNNDIELDINGRVYPILPNGDFYSENMPPKFVVDHIRPDITLKVGNLYYKIMEANGHFYLVEADLSFNAILIKANLLSLLYTLLTIFVLLSFIVYRLSFTVFKPIKNAFDKQKQFISNASHELKTPLAIISANAEVLKESNDNEWVNNIKSQTERMNTMVIEMLALAKLDEGAPVIKKEQINISQEITEIILPFDTVAYEKNLSLNLDIEPNLVIVNNQDALRKITSILIDNAIKYAVSKVDVSLKKINSKIIVLSVANDGSNVPDKDSNKIFERFYRGDVSRTSSTGGSGLGLSIAKSLADANKWKISALSKYNESMEISLTIYL